MKTILIILATITTLTSCSVTKQIPPLEQRCTYDGNGTESQCVRASAPDSEYCRKHK